jgi:Holliday junction resolvase RusA-like endonuclease
MSVKLSLGIDPVPAARPRISRWGAYYPPSYTNFKKLARVSVFNSWGDIPLEGPLRVHASFHARRPKKTKLAHPKPDVDNYLKGLLDACNGIVWRDDCQIVEASVSKQWAEPGLPGHITLEVMPLE